MRGLFAGLLPLALSACVNAEPLTEVSLDGQPARLVQRDGECTLVHAAQHLPLGLKWPCSLSPDRAGRARVEQFNGVPILLVTHIQPHPTLQGECLKTSRAVRLTQPGLEPSAPLSSASCDTGVEDQKMFTGMFRW
jgi:hypothetical protein